MANRTVHWPTFIACVAVSAAIGGAVHLVSGFNFWASWGIVIFAWVGVGISTFFDDERPKPAAAEKEEGIDV